MDRASRSSLRESPGSGSDRWAEACAEVEADLVRRQESAERLRGAIESELDALQSALTEQSARADIAEQARDEALAELERLRAGAGSQDAELEAERKRLREELDRSDEQRKRLAKRLTEWRSQVGKHAQHEVEAALKRAEAREAACRAELRTLQEETSRARTDHEGHVRTFAERIAQLESALAQAEANGGSATDDELLLRCEASERRCVEVEAELVELRAAAAAREGELTRDDDVRELRVEIDIYKESEAALRKEVAELREALEAARSRPAADPAEEEERLAALALASADRIAEDERRDGLIEELRRELADVERELEQEREIRRSLEEEQETSGGSGGSDLERRYELAMDDVRTLKRQVMDLQDDLRKAKASAGSGGNAAVAGGALDWETQKKRLLEQLSESQDAMDQEERTAIENAIRVTDEVIAEKEAELDELRRLLEYRSSMAAEGGAAVGAAALGAALDADELIVEERERLKKLQKEWEEKLRSAEVDLSLERARLSRERLELDEARREIDEFRKEFQADKKPGSKTEPGPKRRWMFRLGLNEQE